MMEKIKNKAFEKCKKIIRNEKGDINTVGKIVIGCIVLVFLITIVGTLLDWGAEKIEQTTNKADEKFDEWNQ